jgi:serine/threonine protein kinase
MNEFASGAYGKLFDDHTGYVYKVFYTEKKDNESGWIREIVSLKNLSHPNIISPKFIGFNFTTDSNVKPKSNMYIKMKKYNQLLKIQFPLKDNDILQGLMDLFNGLAYMHSKLKLLFINFE